MQIILSGSFLISIIDFSQNFRVSFLFPWTADALCFCIAAHWHSALFNVIQQMRHGINEFQVS